MLQLLQTVAIAASDDFTIYLFTKGLVCRAYWGPICISLVYKSIK